jgi:hypothetical protein
MGIHGVTKEEAVCILLGEQPHKDPLKPVTKPNPKAKKYKPCAEHKTKQWTYRDKNGKKLYAAIRYDYPDGKKEFRLGAYNGDQLTMKLDQSVERVPLNLDKFASHSEIWLVEGEKCADALNQLGIFATTFAGGSKAWRDGSGRFFEGKNIVLCPDNDDTGRDYMWQVAKDSEEYARRVRMLDIGTIRDPKGFDIADKIDEMMADGLEDDQITDALLLEKEATLYICEGKYVRSLDYKQSQAQYDLSLTKPGYDLSGFFPDFEGKVRPIIIGDCICITGITGGGKTALADSLAIWLGPSPILKFSVELSVPVSHERALSISSNTPADQIEQLSRDGNQPDMESTIGHIYTVPITGLTVKMLKGEVMKFIKLYDVFPEWIFIDYLQLMKSDGSRYERFSDLAEDLRVLPKELATRVVFLSQESRPDKKATSNGPTLHSAKESGSIENSVSLLLSVRDHEIFENQKVVHVIKNTRGTAGFSCIMDWDGPCTRFSPPACLPPADVDSVEVDDDPGF